MSSVRCGSGSNFNVALSPPAMKLSPLRRPYRAHALAHYPERREWHADFDPNAVVLVSCPSSGCCYCACTVLGFVPAVGGRARCRVVPTDSCSCTPLFCHFVLWYLLYSVFPIHTNITHPIRHQLCFPRGLHLRKQTDNRRITFHTFVLTKDNGSRGRLRVRFEVVCGC